MNTDKVIVILLILEVTLNFLLEKKKQLNKLMDVIANLNEIPFIF